MAEREAIQAIQVAETGSPEVLKLVEMALGQPGPDEILVRHGAIGVNYIDTYFRSGLYKTALPFTPGQEAAGTVEAVGALVTDFRVGDRVAYLHTPGSYAEARIVPAAKAVPVPDQVSDEVAAASLLKGLTAQYLLRRTFKVGREHTILNHAAAGGVGLILGQWARHLGATVIGTAGGPDKVKLALQNGYDHVVDYRSQDFVARTLELTDGRKVDVVYDSVGKDTFPGSLDVLKPLGLWVSFGQSSGPVPPFDITLLNVKGSLFATRPTIFNYNRDAATLRASAKELLDLVASGVIKAAVNQRFALKDARLAHEALEGRATTGATVLIP